MENLIQKLIKLDKKAAKITFSAENNMSDITDIINKKKQVALRSINETSETKLLHIKNEFVKKTEVAKNEIKNQQTRKMKSVEEYYKKNMDGWAEEIFRQVCKL